MESSLDTRVIPRSRSFDDRAERRMGKIMTVLPSTSGIRNQISVVRSPQADQAEAPSIVVHPELSGSRSATITANRRPAMPERVSSFESRSSLGSRHSSIGLPSSHGSPSSTRPRGALAPGSRVELPDSLSRPASVTSFSSFAWQASSTGDLRETLTPSPRSRGSATSSRPRSSAGSSSGSATVDRSLIRRPTRTLPPLAPPPTTRLPGIPSENRPQQETRRPRPPPLRLGAPVPPVATTTRIRPHPFSAEGTALREREARADNAREATLTREALTPRGREQASPPSLSLNKPLPPDPSPPSIRRVPPPPLYSSALVGVRWAINVANTADFTDIPPLEVETASPEAGPSRLGMSGGIPGVTRLARPTTPATDLSECLVVRAKFS